MTQNTLYYGDNLTILREHLKRVLVQIKRGHVKSGNVHDLRGVLDREEGVIGVFITQERRPWR